MLLVAALALIDNTYKIVVTFLARKVKNERNELYICHKSSFYCHQESLFALAFLAGSSSNSVTRISTIVEILKILFKIFSNKNPKNYILLHEFSLFLTQFWSFSHFFLHFHIKIQ